MGYASQTTVSTDRSKAEIEKLVTKYGATEFVSGWRVNGATVGFKMHEKYVKFVLPLPSRADKKFTHQKGGYGTMRPRAKPAIDRMYDQELRRLWRALLLVIKAKLEAVDSGITTFEVEFLPHIMMPDGSTVGDWAVPQVEAMYKTGKFPNLLPGAGGTSGEED